MLDGKQVYLRPLTLEDVTDEYIAWMNDYEIVKYTESRFAGHTRETTENYVEATIKSAAHAFAIIAKDSSKHIGNIKLSGINQHHKYGDVGLIIGVKDYFGRGIATECIRLITDFAFSDLGFHRVWCGIYSLNIGSIKAFQKAGWELYATEPQKYLFEGEYIDGVLMHKINDAN